MKYKNPIIKGFYPDPSVCCANGKFYMVTSSFQYFPAVPLFESSNLVNWKQIGHVLTRQSQIELTNVPDSGGVFAPTIRYSGGRFYMVTTNDTLHKNFYVFTDDIYGEWSEPVFVDQDGIDPSLYFENGNAYFISNGTDDCGNSGVVQCQIDINTGKKLSESRCIWQGTGGRYLESPHMYKIDDFYYLMAAEGGTEYGHMITYARSKSLYGPFESFDKNPVLTNKNKAPYIIQGIGHGDLICDFNSNWYILSLGFRQMHLWMPYHYLGREVFLTPVYFDENGWFSAKNGGTTEEFYEIDGDFEQHFQNTYTFENTDPNIDWCFLRDKHDECYKLSDKAFVLKGRDITLNDTASPTFVALRQRDFCGKLHCKLKIDGDCAGISVYMCEHEHYDIMISKRSGGYSAVLMLNIGNIKHEESSVQLKTNMAELEICFDNFSYKFAIIENGNRSELGFGMAKYLSSEISSPFTGVVFGLFAQGISIAEFTQFKVEYDT